MSHRVLPIAVGAALLLSRAVVAASISPEDFDNPTALDFEDYSGFVGGPDYPDPWLAEGVRITGFASDGRVSVYPNSNNAVEIEFLDPVQRVGADVLYSISDPTRLEVYDANGSPLGHIDGVGPRFLGLDVGAPSIVQARFIDLPDNWYTFPHIDSLYFEAVPEPNSLSLLAIGALGILVCRRWTRYRSPIPA